MSFSYRAHNHMYGTSKLTRHVMAQAMLCLELSGRRSFPSYEADVDDERASLDTSYLSRSVHDIVNALHARPEGFSIN